MRAAFDPLRLARSPRNALGVEFVSGPGDVLSIPSGHDGWVVGDEPAVVIDFHGASTYAKRG